MAPDTAPTGPGNADDFIARVQWVGVGRSRFGRTYGMVMVVTHVRRKEVALLVQAYLQRVLMPRHGEARRICIGYALSMRSVFEEGGGALRERSVPRLHSG